MTYMTDRYEWMGWIIDGKVELMHQMDWMHGIGMWMVGWDAFVGRYSID